MLRPRAAAGCALFAVMICSGVVAGQTPSGTLLPTPPLRVDTASSPTTGLGAGLLSLAVPGAGQYRLGQSRSWAYLALEVAAWTVQLSQEAEGRRLRNQYHDLAWNAARFHTMPRREGTWAYYEVLIHWTRSGAYDANPTEAGTQPEPDPSTYNGSVWLLAREIYFPPGQTPSPGSPAYQEALAYYEARAYGPAFLWDWSSSPGEQQKYARLINRSDSGFRRATIALGAVFANHLISAIDAYISGRDSGARDRVHLTLEPDMMLGSTRWTARLRIPTR